MLTYQNPINLYFLGIVIYDIIFTLIMVPYIFMIRKRSKESAHMKIITTPMQYFSLGMFFPLIIHIITHLEGIFTVTMNVDVFYMLGYALYSFFWLIGINYYLNNTIRLPANIRNRFNIFTRTLLSFSMISFILVFLMLTFPILVEHLSRVGFLLTFVGLGLGIAMLFIAFIIAIRKERERNPSKIVKARIDLLQQIIIIQIIEGILFSALAGSVAAFPHYRNQLNFILFLISDALFALSVIMLYLSIDIPNRIRVKYNISPSRFSYIKQN